MDELELFASLRPEVTPLTKGERDAIRSRSSTGTAGGQEPPSRHATGRRPGAVRNGSRRRILVAAATLTLLVGTSAVVNLSRRGPGNAATVDMANADTSSESDTSDDFRQTAAAAVPSFTDGTLTSGASGYCGFTTDQLADAPWALDGTVLSIATDGPGVWGSASSAMVHLKVNASFRGDGAEVADIVVPIGGELGTSLQRVQTGRRVLVAGELGEDGSPLAWACGFVTPWSPEENAIWVEAFR